MPSRRDIPHIFDLPAAPNLEQQRKRAKDLLEAVRAGDGEALARFVRLHPRFASAAATIRADARLNDAQWVTRASTASAAGRV